MSIFAIPVIPKGYFEDLIAHSSRFRGILVILGCFSRFRDFKAIIWIHSKPKKCTKKKRKGKSQWQSWSDQKLFIEYTSWRCLSKASCNNFLSSSWHHRRSIVVYGNQTANGLFQSIMSTGLYRRVKGC